MGRVRAREGRSSGHRIRCAFSLVELVIVVTIIGIISAIAVPRMSSAATGASASALEASISSVRGAIDAYYAEHGSYPGYVPGLGSADGTWFVDQLVMYTNKQGQTSASRTGAYLFGPYLRKPFPKNPCNQLADVHVKANPAAADPANGSVGWVAVLSTGDFGISATDTALDDIGLVQPEKKLDVRLR